MRFLPLVLIPLAACSNEANHLGNPLLLPISGLGTLAENAVYDHRRGKVETLVKSKYPEILSQIEAGGGPYLDQAMTLARIPQADRPARLIQLKSDLSIYRSSPDALVVALMVYGN